MDREHVNEAQLELQAFLPVRLVDLREGRS
jgi:hypothetical protein